MCICLSEQHQMLHDIITIILQCFVSIHKQKWHSILLLINAIFIVKITFCIIWFYYITILYFVHCVTRTLCEIVLKYILLINIYMYCKNNNKKNYAKKMYVCVKKQKTKVLFSKALPRRLWLVVVFTTFCDIPYVDTQLSLVRYRLSGAVAQKYQRKRLIVQ